MTEPRPLIAVVDDEEPIYQAWAGRIAYLWGYAMVNSHNRRATFASVTSKHGNVPDRNGGVLPMARWARPRC